MAWDYECADFIVRISTITTCTPSLLKLVVNRVRMRKNAAGTRMVQEIPPQFRSIALRRAKVDERILVVLLGGTGFPTQVQHYYCGIIYERI